MASSGQTFSQEVSPPVKFRVVFEAAEEGGYVVTCPALPGCVCEGETLEEAQANIQEAIVGYLESLRQHNEPIPASP